MLKVLSWAVRLFRKPASPPPTTPPTNRRDLDRRNGVPVAWSDTMPDGTRKSHVLLVDVPNAQVQSERLAAFRKAYIEWLVQALPLWINVYVHDHDWKRVHDLLQAADNRVLWLLANPPTAARKGA